MQWHHSLSPPFWQKYHSLSNRRNPWDHHTLINLLFGGEKKKINTTRQTSQFLWWNKTWVYMGSWTTVSIFRNEPTFPASVMLWLGSPSERYVVSHVYLLYPSHVKIFDTSPSSGYSDLSSPLASRLSPPCLRKITELHCCLLPPPKTTTPLSPSVRTAPPHPIPKYQRRQDASPAATSRWPLGTRAKAPQVIPDRAKGTHKHDRCWWFSRATTGRRLPPWSLESTDPASLSPML